MNIDDGVPFGVMRFLKNQYYKHYFRRLNRKEQSRMFYKNRRKGK